MPVRRSAPYVVLECQPTRAHRNSIGNVQRRRVPGMPTQRLERGRNATGYRKRDWSSSEDATGHHLKMQLAISVAVRTYYVLGLSEAGLSLRLLRFGDHAASETVPSPPATHSRADPWTY